MSQEKPLSTVTVRHGSLRESREQQHAAVARAGAAPVAAGASASSAEVTFEGTVRTTVLPKAAGPDQAATPDYERRFQTVKVLGAGGMGEVTLAEDRDIDRRVALKR